LAASRVDLTAYLDSYPETGDFRFYTRSDGGSYLVQINDAVESKNATSVVESTTEDGTTASEVAELIHGRELREGSSFLGALELVGALRRTLPFRLALGKPQPFRLGFKVLFQGVRAGKATAVGTRTFLGFGSVTTPLGTFNNAAHILSSLTLTIKTTGPVTTIAMSTTDAWYVVGLGGVAFTRSTQTYQNGALISSKGPFDYAFDHGAYRGVPQP
jgi:hypothetical protein